MAVPLNPTQESVPPNSFRELLVGLIAAVADAVLLWLHRLAVLNSTGVPVAVCLDF